MIELYIDDRLRNRKVTFFDKFTMSLRYDSMASAFSFNCYFNPDNIEQKELLCVGHFHIARLYYTPKGSSQKQLFLTGYMITEGFSGSSVKEWVSVGGYSYPGVLEDCNIPPQSYPLQYDGLSLRQIAQKILPYFNIKMIVDGAVSADMDKTYEKTEASETQSIKDFLTGLAIQRNIVISHTPEGALRFTKALTKQKPILTYGGEGGIPCPDMKLVFNGQGMHSHITVIKQADKDGGNAGEFTIRNPYVPFVYRPKVVTQSSGDDNDTEKAARSALAAELKNLRITITTDRWDINGVLIMPNNIIEVTNSSIYLYKKVRLFVESVDFSGDADKNTAVINCCVPEAYNDETPEYLFRGINLH